MVRDIETHSNSGGNDQKVLSEGYTRVLLTEFYWVFALIPLLGAKTHKRLKLAQVHYLL